jgi:capsid portal protein
LHIRNYVNQFFEHNAVPRYAVVVTGGVLSDEIKKGLIDYFTTEVKGQAHKTLVLCLPSSPTKEIKIEFKQLDTAHKEADFLETERRNQSNIQVAHGTPPAILGVAEHSELGSGKGLSQAELYKDRIVAPAQYFWQEKLYELTSKGLGITDAYITFSPFDVRDRYMQSQVLTNLLDRGIYNINDALEELDKPPVPGGDVNFVKGDKFIKIEDLATLNSTVPSENTNEEPQPGTENNSQEGDNELPPTE